MELPLLDHCFTPLCKLYLALCPYLKTKGGGGKKRDIILGFPKLISLLQFCPQSFNMLQIVPQNFYFFSNCILKLVLIIERCMCDLRMPFRKINNRSILMSDTNKSIKVDNNSQKVTLVSSSIKMPRAGNAHLFSFLVILTETTDGRYN